MNDDDRARLDYFQKHALPWQIEHMKFRAIGLQIFIPIQGVLFGAWGVSKSWPIPCFGIACCVCLFLWDQRTRFIIGRVHEWGRQLADRHFFPLDGAGKPTDGVHVVFGASLDKSGRVVPTPISCQSHTVAIRILLLTAAIIWILILCDVGGVVLIGKVMIDSDNRVQISRLD